MKTHRVVVSNQSLLFLRGAKSEGVLVLTLSLDVCHFRISKQRQVENSKGQVSQLHPLQADFPGNKTQLMYFWAEETQNDVLRLLLEA